MAMSRAAALAMRTALHFCRQSLSQKHHLLPAVASSKLLSAPTAPPSHCHFRLFSDAQTQGWDQLPLSRSVFMEQLSSCSSPSDVLDLATRLSPTPTQLSHGLSRMWSSLKKLTEEQRRAELRLMWEHAAWEPLLQQAVGGVTHLPTAHLAYTLLALVHLGVEPRTQVMQTYLRAAQERVKYFDDKDLSILSSCLEKLEEGANVRALKRGIRLLVEARLPRIENVLHLQTMMRLVGKDSPLVLKQKLEAKALSLSDQFSLPNAHYMITSMAALGFCSKPLLSLCSRKISENLSDVPYNRLLTALMACRDLRFRDQQLLNAVSEHGASMVHVWNHKQLVLVLACLESHHFCPESFLDSYSERIQSDPDALTLRELLCVLRVCASLSYHPPSLVWCLAAALEQYLPRMNPVQLLNAQYHLAVVGHFSPALLQALLQEVTVQELREKETKFVEAQMSVVTLCLRLERPDLLQSLPVPAPPPHSPAAPPHSPAAHSRAQFSSALQTLTQSADGWDVVEGQLLEGQHFVDAVLTQKRRDLEESSVEAKSQRVAVLCVPASAFCFGTSRPRGPFALRLRHLRVLGYRPLLIPAQELLPLTEQQRVDFLRRRLFPEDTSANGRP